MAFLLHKVDSNAPFAIRFLKYCLPSLQQEQKNMHFRKPKDPNEAVTIDKILITHIPLTCT